MPSHSAKLITLDEDFSLETSKNDVIIRSLKSNKILFSTNELARKNFQTQLKNSGGFGLYYQEDYRVLSLVGPFLSLKYHVYSVGEKNGIGVGAHPAEETRYVSIDLRRPELLSKRLFALYEGAHSNQKNMLKLTDIFSEKEVLAALLADKIISEPLLRANIRVKSTKQLIQELFHGPLPEPLCGEYDDSLLNAFVFHHLEGGKVAVRISVSGAGPCRNNLTELGILLPIPALWRSDFNLAQKGKAGFLQRSQRQKDLKAVSYEFEHK